MDGFLSVASILIITTGDELGEEAADLQPADLQSRTKSMKGGVLIIDTAKRDT
jgi:hypothetical protein